MEEDLLDSLHDCMDKVEKKIAELINSMVLEGDKLEQSKEMVGDLMSNIYKLSGAVAYLYSQIEIMEHRIKCNEKFKSLDYDPSYKYKGEKQCQLEKY